MTRLNTLLQRIIYLLVASLPIIFLPGCEPGEIDISIPQSPAQMALASTAVNDETVFLTLGYTFNALSNIYDSSDEGSGTLAKILVDSALVTLSAKNNTDTLLEIYPGIYGNAISPLQTNEIYTLQCKDLRTGKSVTASTMYLPLLPVITATPAITRQDEDTTVKLNLEFNKAQGNDMHYYMLSYSRLNPTTTPSPVNSATFSFNSLKNLELYTDADAINGIIKVSPLLNINYKDTLYAQVGQIEKGYFNYLTAYKRTGSLFNQITGEPITLPTNVITGYGYFCLYQAQRFVFDLNEY